MLLYFVIWEKIITHGSAKIEMGVYVHPKVILCVLGLYSYILKKYSYYTVLGVKLQASHFSAA
jgi:hypothetical protein